MLHIRFEIQCLGIGKAPMNNMVPCPPFLTVVSIVDGQMNKNCLLLQYAFTGQLLGNQFRVVRPDDHTIWTVQLPRDQRMSRYSSPYSPCN
jgi:hypothetical protein